VFGHLPAFARDSVDRLVSRSPNELLRWVACARQFASLSLSLSGLAPRQLPSECEAQLQKDARTLTDLTRDALKMADPASTCDEEVKLSERVILAAANVLRMLEAAWAAPTESAEQRATLSLSAAIGSANRQLVEATGTDARGVHSAAADLEPRFESGPAPSPARGRVNLATEARAPSTTKLEQVDDALEAVSYRYEPELLGWLRRAQVFAATVVTLLIHRHIRQFRYFISTLTAAVMLLLLAVTSYPFEPYRLLLTCMWTLVAAVVGAGLWVYVQLDRNTLVSLMSGTPPNRLTLDSAFALRVVTWTFVPLLSVAAAQYPDLAQLLFKLVAPFANTLK
jgi:hypothetical protein